MLQPVSWNRTFIQLSAWASFKILFSPLWKAGVFPGLPCCQVVTLSGSQMPPGPLLLIVPVLQYLSHQLIRRLKICGVSPLIRYLFSLQTLGLSALWKIELAKNCLKDGISVTVRLISILFPFSTSGHSVVLWCNDFLFFCFSSFSSCSQVAKMFPNKLSYYYFKCNLSKLLPPIPTVLSFVEKDILLWFFSHSICFPLDQQTYILKWTTRQRKVKM